MNILDKYVEIDLQEVETFIKNPDFHYYLLNNLTDFNSAAFILQTLINTVDEAYRQTEAE